MNQAKSAVELVNILKAYRPFPRLLILTCSILIIANPMFEFCPFMSGKLSNIIISINAIIILLTINFSSKKRLLDDFIGKEFSEIDKIRNILILAQSEGKNKDTRLGVTLKSGDKLEGFLAGQIASPHGVGISYQLTDSYGKNIDKIPLKEIVTVKII